MQTVLFNKACLLFACVCIALQKRLLSVRTPCPFAAYTRRCGNVPSIYARIPSSACKPSIPSQAQTGANKLSETNVSQSGKPYENTRADRRVLRRGGREGEKSHLD